MAAFRHVTLLSEEARPAPFAPVRVLGSAAAAIGLTVPAVLLVRLYAGRPLLLGLDGTEAVMQCT